MLKSFFAILAISAIAKAHVETFTSTNEPFYDNAPVLVKFYAPWCGWCKKFAPDYSEISNRLENTNVRVARINCDENKDFCVNNYKIKGYPTLLLLKKDESGNEIRIPFKGIRDVENVLEFVEENVDVCEYQENMVEEDKEDDVQMDILEKATDFVKDEIKDMKNNVKDAKDEIKDKITYVESHMKETAENVEEIIYDKMENGFNTPITDKAQLYLQHIYQKYFGTNEEDEGIISKPVAEYWEQYMKEDVEDYVENVKEEL